MSIRYPNIGMRILELHVQSSPVIRVNRRDAHCRSKDIVCFSHKIK